MMCLMWDGESGNNTRAPSHIYSSQKHKQVAMVVSNEPLVSKIEIESVDAFDAVSVTSSFSTSKSSSKGSTKSSRGSSSSSSSSSNKNTSDNNGNNNNSCSNSNNISNKSVDRGNCNMTTHNDTNGGNGSKASLASSSQSSHSPSGFQVPDASQRFRLQVTGGNPSSSPARKVSSSSATTSSAKQFYRVCPNGQKAFIRLPKQLQDYIPENVWEVFGIAIMAPLSHGASRENVFAIRMHVMAIFIPCVLAWFATIVWGRHHHLLVLENEPRLEIKTDTLFFAILSGLVWALVACTGIKCLLHRARRNMEIKTFQMIDHSTRHWEPIFRGLGWNVTFKVDDESTRLTDPTKMLKSYLVFEPVGSMAENETTQATIRLDDQV
jgi:hypothetical protein